MWEKYREGIGARWLVLTMNYGPEQNCDATLPGQWAGADGNLSAEGVAVR